ncbi:hypothetical protein [Rhizosaccharibacter radicis]|uniref:Uncharacterized protein n=1 Tax=Rhizosaccharibacter radicis TaxID=2782605 RepID=A0ABT1VUD0_9PROT|nr:hypothetical protein [Acetobacteraceae bacterium KSS12]
MTHLFRGAVLLALLGLGACDVTGVAPPSSQQKTNAVPLGSPGSNAP